MDGLEDGRRDRFCPRRDGGEFSCFDWFKVTNTAGRSEPAEEDGDDLDGWSRVLSPPLSCLVLTPVSTATSPEQQRVTSDPNPNHRHRFWVCLWFMTYGEVLRWSSEEGLVQRWIRPPWVRHGGMFSTEQRSDTFLRRTCRETIGSDGNNSPTFCSGTKT